MIRLRQRLRGVAGTALSWAAGWAPIGALLGTSDVLKLDLLSRSGPGAALDAILGGAAVCGLAGAISGALFAAGLLLAEQTGQQIEELSLGRFAILGGAGAALLPLALSIAGAGGVFASAALLTAGAFALLGSGSASAMLLLARAGAASARPQGQIGAPPT